MRSNDKKTSLFSNFEEYSKSLPVRRIEAQRGSTLKSEHVPLYSLPHWARDEDIDSLATQLESEATPARAKVRYLAAPTASGKTSCILPAFLRSAKRQGGFTHYLYFAFSNNNNNNFRLAPVYPNEDLDIAKDQGADFILECVKRLLDGRSTSVNGPHKIPRNETPPGLTDTQEDLKATLQLKTPDRPPRILVHLDEHRKMCERKHRGGNKSEGAEFSRGAMEALAQVDGVTIVATYLEQPPVDAADSSAVCRGIVTMPCLDIEKTMEEIEELRFHESHPPTKFNREQRRLWATLRFRLAMKLTQTGLSNLHVRNTKMDNLLKDFHEAYSETEDTTEALRKCINLCKIEDIEPDTKLTPNAALLLLGIKDNDDENWEEIQRQVSSLITVSEDDGAGIVTASLRRLLEMSDENFPVYSQGQSLFRRVLTRKDGLSSTPLEAAYQWSLSCSFARLKRLAFLQDEFPFEFECKRLSEGRLFEGTDSNNFDPTFPQVKPNTMYYVEEGKDAVTHPLCDIFFRTDNQELVLVDVTGSLRDVVEEKKAKLAEWIESKKGEVADFQLCGVVLAPLANRPSYSEKSVQVVCGNDAKKLLGGLQQVFRWME